MFSVAFLFPDIDLKKVKEMLEEADQTFPREQKAGNFALQRE